MGRTINSVGKAGKRRPLKGKTTKLRRRTRGRGSSDVAQEPEAARLTRELGDALQRQSATTDILKVIATSRSDVRPVFEAIAASANRLIGGFSTAVYRFADGMAYLVALTPTTPAADEILKRAFPRPTAGLPQFERVLAGKMFEIPNVDETLKAELRKIATARGVCSVLGVPLVNNDKTIGLITVTRKETGSFADHHVKLLQTFADQAVIAIENARLFEDLQAKTRDLEESLERQTATSEVLQVISSSPGELRPVFESMLANATRICGANFGTMNLCEEGIFRPVAHYNVPAAYAASLASTAFKPHPQSGLGTVAETHQVLHIEDIRTLPPYLEGDPSVVKIADLAGARTYFVAPMLKENQLIGAITIFRQEVRPFAVRQIELVANFAKQAVIAIENTRLLRELRESLQQQTATADVLKIISRSSIDLDTVLDTLVETVARLCRADQTYMFRRRDDSYHLAASHGLSQEAKEFFDTHPFAPDRGSLSGRVELERRAVHIPDVLQDAEYTHPAQKLAGYRTMLGIPLLRGDELIGIFAIDRTRVEPFTNKEIELATSFADQAVIAIENARLFEELRQSLQQQTATADVLKVISQSAFDLGTVLQTLVESAAHLCEADKATISRKIGEFFYRAETYGFSDEFMDYVKDIPIAPERGSAHGRVLLEGKPVHILDVEADPEFTFVDASRLDGFRTVLAVPILREGVPIGALALTRSEVRAFTDKQIELVLTFADQAAIAIENARLVGELRERQAELRVTFDNMGDGVVMFGADGRLVAWNRNFQTILDLPDELLAQRPTYVDYVTILAERGEFGNDIEAELSRRLQDTDEELRLERTRPDGRIIEVRRNPVPGGGFVLIYADVTKRKQAEEAIRVARDAAETALRELQTAQASLVHAQKMAALGQVTAGIAHEIKNPLNFVNNFAGLSVELLDELKDAEARSVGAPDRGKRAEIAEIIGLLTGNLQKIVEHGRRADGIVRSMLQHSRGSSDDRQSTDLNALAEEALNLAYHGARAQDPNFDIALERDLDRNLAPVDVVPQELTRVLLNLIGNGFYAANKRSRESDGTYQPALKVTTCEFGEGVEVRVRDNGIGVPTEDRDKLFQPFFTTKPTGEGTGLGLSISYEIVTQQHGGTITVNSEVGDFTEFTVRLPRRGRAAAG